MPTMDPQVVNPVPLAVTSDPRWLAAERIANSRCFQRSSRLRDFLLYIVRCELEGKTGEISEQNIGERVFGRRENYSPLDDNIVRVSARQLRLRLKEFYDSEGREEPWVIEIPKGGYVPTFQARIPPQDAIITEIPLPTGTPKRTLLWLAIPLILATGLVWWASSNHILNIRKEPDPNIVRIIFRKTQDPIQIILSDSALAAMQSMLGHSFSLDDYSNGSYRTLPPNLKGNTQDVAVWNTLADQQTANIGDFGAALHLRDSLSLANRQQTIMRSARDMRARDFRAGDYIVLGGPSSNPWVHLLEQEPFNFYFERDPAVRAFIIGNRNPAPGEQSAYRGYEEGYEYARIALVPNLTKTGQALMIAGITMESTEAAVDFCLSPDSMKLLAHLPSNGKNSVAPFEALLRTKQEDGTGVKAELIAVRPLMSK